MKQRRFVGKLQKSARRALVVFLAIIFTLTINIIVSESGRGRGRPRAAHRGGQGSIRHQGEARERPQESDRRKSNRRHARRHHRGSIRHYEVYDYDDDEYYDDYCYDYGDDCYYDDYYDDCVCDD